MLVKRSLFYIFTFTMMIILSVITRNVVISGVITWVTVVIGYIIIGYKRHNKRINLIEEACDPEAFLEATEKQRKITGKNRKINAYLNIDKAAGLMLLGDFEKGKKILFSINKSFLSVKNPTFQIYTINLVACLYELGEIEAAEEIYEREIPLLAPVSKAMVLQVKILVAERFFFLGRYEESKEHYQQLLSEKLSKRKHISIIYRLAQIDEKLGALEAAKDKYTEVAQQANKLWIANQAKKSLEERI